MAEGNAGTSARAASRSNNNNDKNCDFKLELK